MARVNPIILFELKTSKGVNTKKNVAASLFPLSIVNNEMGLNKIKGNIL